MSAGCSDLTVVRDRLKLKGSSLLGEIGFWAAGRNQSDLDGLFVDRKITWGLEHQLLDGFETDQVFDSLIDLDRIWQNIDLGCDLRRCFAATAPTICHKNGIWR